MGNQDGELAISGLQRVRKTHEHASRNKSSSTNSHHEIRVELGLDPGCGLLDENLREVLECRLRLFLYCS